MFSIPSPRRHPSEDELWEAYTAGAENGFDHATEGVAIDYDLLRTDFDAWQEARVV
jgi:hypothetical protein